jgi:hypothetical protein
MAAAREVLEVIREGKALGDDPAALKRLLKMFPGEVRVSGAPRWGYLPMTLKASWRRFTNIQAGSEGNRWPV